MAFTHILVPTDFSAPAAQALRYALEEATLHHAQVTLLHVRPPHTGTEVYSIGGAPRTVVGFDPALEGRLGAAHPPQPTIVRQDHDEEALTALRDLMLDALPGCVGGRNRNRPSSGHYCAHGTRAWGGSHRHGDPRAYRTATHAPGECRRTSGPVGPVSSIDGQGSADRSEE